MFGKGSLEDAKAMAAEFTRAKHSKRRANPTAGSGTRIDRGRPVNTQPRPENTWSRPERHVPRDTSMLTANPQGNTFRPVASQNLYSNGYSNSRGHPPAEPRGLPASSHTPYLASASNPQSFVQPERIVPQQSVTTPQNPSSYQADTTTQRYIPSPVAATPVPKSQDAQRINQPVTGYTARAESRPADDDDVTMTDADPAGGYKKFGTKGLEASRWNTNETMNETYETFDRGSRFMPVPERRGSRPPTGHKTSSGMITGPGLADSRWASDT
ncbi:hypothetical protein F4818DRAFT_213057 [Hypoxylon cercidicola]|nr:hypothetical protein F4818DRAFT_213057 [Hypoxylon cercidicola]